MYFVKQRKSYIKKDRNRSKKCTFYSWQPRNLINSGSDKVCLSSHSTYSACAIRPACSLIFRWSSSLFLQFLLFKLQWISNGLSLLTLHCPVMLFNIHLVHKIPPILTLWLSHLIIVYIWMLAIFIPDIIWLLSNGW